MINYAIVHYFCEWVVSKHWSGYFETFIYVLELFSIMGVGGGGV